jgi:hypothetical protein
MNFIHYDNVNDGGMILRMSFVTPLRALQKTVIIIFSNPNYGKYVTFVLNLLLSILRFSNHFTTCMWSLSEYGSTTSISKAVVVVYAIVITIAICVK